MQIVEIIDRCEEGQGILRPFICRADDQNLYYAKGSNSTVLGLIREWIASNLAISFGLPTPKSHLLYIDPELKSVIDNSCWLSDLHFEYLFGSKSVAPCETLTISDVRSIPLQLQRDVFIFDYWIRNADRHLGPKAGNVNLLLQAQTKTLQVIDFNLAFDDQFAFDEMSTHVFKDAMTSGAIDPACKAEYLNRMKSVMEDLPTWINQIPDEWLEYSEAVAPLLNSIQETLTQGSSDDFWGKLL